MQTPGQILQQYWGYESFRPLQQEIIGSILDGRDTLALLPTGGGKSLCYQVPALLKDGFCLVVSPLIALMQDQVSRLKELDISAACIYSGMHYSDVRRTLDNAMHDAYKLLYVSPERLQTVLFQDYMTEFDVSLIAVDEAHCISQWGYDFRPSYLQIAEIRETYPRTPVLALTASATPDVQQDIATQLRMREPAIFHQSFSRSNLFYDIRYSENKNADTLRSFSDAGAPKSSIIYCRSRKRTEAITKHLDQSGLHAIAYHAGMPKEQREEAQEQWITGKVPIMAATTAFGMGIDKADVRTVLHYDAPEHIEAWYQEAGRAGRDSAPAHALTLYNNTDIKRLRDSIDLQYPPEAYLRHVYQCVAEYLQIPIGAEPDQYYPFDVFDFCRKFSLEIAETLSALKLLEQEELWTLSEAVYSPATIQFTTDRHTLDGLEQAHPDHYYVAVGLLRMYNTIFHFPTPVREMAIARQLRMQRDEVIAIIDQLHQLGILHYSKPGEGPQMFFHHYRVDSRYLIIDMNRIARLRKRHETRTNAMIAFLENTTVCRESMFLRYFGEQAANYCGHCDVCRRKAGQTTPDAELKQQLIKALKQPTSLQQLVAPYPLSIREKVLELIRQMLDEGDLAMNHDLIHAR